MHLIPMLTCVRVQCSINMFLVIIFVGASSSLADLKPSPTFWIKKTTETFF